MLSIKHVVSLILLIISLVITVYSVCKFVVFISSPVDTERVLENWNFKQLLESSDLLKLICRNLLWNSFWTVLFILQHSFCKTETVKRFWTKIGFGICERAAYNLISGYTLLVSFLKSLNFIK